MTWRSTCIPHVPTWFVLEGILPCQVTRPSYTLLWPMRVRGRDCIDLPYSQVPFIERLPPQELYGLVFQGRAFCGWTIFFCKSYLLCNKILPLIFKRFRLVSLPIKAKTPSLEKKRLCCCCVPSNRRGTGHQMFV